MCAQKPHLLAPIRTGREGMGPYVPETEAPVSRTVHRTPRHLDDPLKILGFTLAQWLVLALGALLLWACLAFLPAFIPATLRLSLGAVLVGLPLGLTFAADTARSLVELPRRVLHGLRAPTNYVPGPPHRGPLRLVLTDDATRGEGEDAER